MIPFITHLPKFLFHTVAAKFYGVKLHWLTTQHQRRTRRILELERELAHRRA